MLDNRDWLYRYHTTINPEQFRLRLVTHAFFVAARRLEYTLERSVPKLEGKARWTCRLWLEKMLKGSARPFNAVLRILPQEDFELLQPHIEERNIPPGTVLYNAGDQIEFVYFPCGQALVSYVIAAEDGREVRAIMVGREGAVGGIISGDLLPTHSRLVVTAGPTFSRIHVDTLERAKAKSISIRRAFARYSDCLLTQALQAIACNAVHSIEQRTAKWILQFAERAESSELSLTEEELATHLGVGRNYLTRIALSLKSQGLLETSRGKIVICDREALAKRSCRCDVWVSQYFQRAFGSRARSEDQQ